MSTTQRITIDELDARAAAGEFDGPLGPMHVELVEGELREMSPIGARQMWVIRRLSRWSQRVLLPSRGVFDTPGALELPDSSSVLQPDLLWTRADSEDWNHRPQASDVLLLIEVSESTFRYDVGEKAVLYARAGIADYWVVDLARRQLICFREPTEQGYLQRRELGRDARISPLALPDAVLEIQDVFPQETPAAAPDETEDN